MPIELLFNFQSRSFFASTKHTLSLIALIHSHHAAQRRVDLWGPGLSIRRVCVVWDRRLEFYESIILHPFHLHTCCHNPWTRSNSAQAYEIWRQSSQPFHAPRAIPPEKPHLASRSICCIERPCTTPQWLLTYPTFLQESHFASHSLCCTNSPRSPQHWRSIFTTICQRLCVASQAIRICAFNCQCLDHSH